MSAYRGSGGGSWVRGGQDVSSYGNMQQYGNSHQQGYQQPFDQMSEAFHQSNAPLDGPRRFTGRVTKLVNDYGFVDSEVFFQLRAVKGKFPREGDTVYCEAVFNPKAPCKWTATSVQVQPIDDHRNGTDKRTMGRGGPTGRRSPRRQSPARKMSPKRHSPPRNRRTRSPHKRMSPKRGPKRSPVRDRSPINKRKNYSLILSNIDLEATDSSCIELKRRFPNLYIPSDFFLCKSFWQQSFPELCPLNLELSHCSFAVCPREKRLPGAKLPPKEPADIDYRHQAKVVLLNAPIMPEIQEQCFPSERRERVQRHMLSTMYFLVGVKDRKFEAIGGPWSPSMDGEDPEEPQTLINTAVRSTKYMTGIDLSECTSWPKITEIHYRREKDGEVTMEKVTIFFPDVWRCVPTPQEWSQMQETLTKEPEVEEPTASAGAEEPQEVKDEDEVLLPDGSDPRQMKVTDLRVELEKRNLGTKGVKQALADRLIEFLRQERSEKVVVEDAEMKDEEAEGQREAEKTVEKVEDKAEEKEAAPIFDLPKLPAIVVTPNREVHRGNFDCRLMSVVRLLEYNESDNKEYSFELNVFCELFKSMMYRDHAFNLYKQLLEAPDLNREQETRNAGKKKREELKTSKDDVKEDPKAVAEADEIEIEIKDEVDEDYEKIFDEKTIRNPSLMMSCLYFDLVGVGYLTTKEVENIVLSLNLKLSRAQVRSVLKKVVEKDGNFVYKKLTNRVLAPEEPPEGFEHHTPLTTEAFRLVLKGNSSLLGEEETRKPCVFIDSDKLKEQLEKSERFSVELTAEFKKAQATLDSKESHLERLKKDKERLEGDLAKAEKSVQELQKDLRASRNFSHDIRRTSLSAKNQLQKIVSSLQSCLDKEKNKEETKTVANKDEKEAEDEAVKVEEVKVETEESVEVVKAEVDEDSVEKDEEPKAKRVRTSPVKAANKKK